MTEPTPLVDDDQGWRDSPAQLYAYHLILWTIVCSTMAIPSLMLAQSGDYDGWAMGLGICIFIVIFTIVGASDFVRQLMRRPFVRTTCYIGFAARMVISLIFPMGMLVDVWTGAVSAAVGEIVFHKDPTGFAATLVITLMQGVWLTMLLGAFMALVYAWQRSGATDPPDGQFCLKCGYDLRASHGQCPECGKRFHAPRARRPVM